MKSLGIITAVTSPSTGFDMTRNSVEQLQDRGCPIDWYVIIGESDENLAIELDRANLTLGSHLHVEGEVLAGIYGATNQGLLRVTNDYFLILHCGDIVYPQLLDQIDRLDTNFVHAFGTDWHTATGATAIRKATNKTQPWLARMPHHQTMLFPRHFANRPYERRFPVAADQDLKLELWRSGTLMMHDEVIGSSLIGGLTTRRLSWKEARDRYCESREVFLRHFLQPWAEMLAFGYAFRYAMSVLGLATSHETPRG